jgi:hypothetical protein
MARSKNATALFEVIHTSKKPPKAGPTGGAIPAPKWWAKGSKPADRPAPPAPHGSTEAEEAHDDEDPHVEPSGGTRRSWLAAARQKAAAQQRSPEAAAEDEPVDDEPADDAPSRVYITRIYPSDAVDKADDTTDGGAAAQAAADELSDEPAPETATSSKSFFSKPMNSRSAPVDAQAADRPSWAERRARVLADRDQSSPSSDPSFDPTADVDPADLRSPRPRKRVTPEFDDVPPPAPRVPKPRKSAGPKPSAYRVDSDSAVAVDREAGEVRFRLSYGGAIFAAAILLVLVVIAYLAGRQWSPGTEAIADGTAAGRSTSDGATSTVTPANGDASGMMAAVSTTAPTAAATPPSPPTLVTSQVPTAAPVVVQPSATPPEPVARQAGLLYAVVQSYPDRETADRAGDFLNRNGVPCTVIPGLNGFALRDWFSVVGLQGFPRGDHAAALQNYLRQLTALGPKFSSKVYNQFQPQLYTWRSDSDVPRP